MKYIAPVAELLAFEVVSVVLASAPFEENYCQVEVPFDPDF